MMHEINFYAIVQKEGLGMDKCIEDSKYRMKRYGVTPDLLCVPPQLLLYMALAPEEKLLYDKGGPNAAATFEAGVEGFKARQYRGMGVVTSDPFEITDDSEAVQMLQRSTQVGEFYVMGPPVVPLNMEDPKGARNFLDIVVFDEESDRHVVIPWEDAVAASFCEMVRDGEKVNPDTQLTKSNGIKDALALYKKQTEDDKKPSSGESLKVTRNENNLVAAEWRELANCWRIIAKMGTRRNASGEELVFPATNDKVGELTGGSGEMDKDPFSIGEDFRGRSIQKFMEEPKFRVYCVVARPFIEHVMQSAVMTVSGRDTGAMLFGPSDMQISANTQVKTIEGHYTGHFKAVIHKPQNVFVMRDIACSAYVAGMNTQFFGFEKNQTIANRYTSNRAKNQIMRRLSFADEVGSKYQSCMSFPASAAEYEEGSMDTVISVTSRVLPWEVNPSQHHENFPGGDKMYEQYQRILQLGQIHYGEDTRAAENMDFISQGATNNALCFMGPHRKFSHISRSHFELIPGQGHFGPDALPGDARWRRGETVSQKTARDQMISLEAVASSQLAFQPRG